MKLEAAVQVDLGGFDLDVNLVVASGEMVVLLGPNGAGKTTLLRALAGLVRLGAGRVVLGDRVLEDTATGVRVPPERRPVGVVFQDYRLFPYLSAAENVAFGLRCNGVRRPEAHKRAHGLLANLGLVEYADHRPASLSGGQCQRVALARALATEPALLLLDEPLSALDASTRNDARHELLRQLSSYRGARLLITHDPVEAMALADRLVVIEEGRTVQVGCPAEVVARPRSAWVSELVGLNFFRGEGLGDHIRLVGGELMAAAGAGKGDVLAVAHPRAVALYLDPPEGTPRNVWRGVVAGIHPEGDRVRVRVVGPIALVAEVTPEAMAELRIDIGMEVWASLKATEVAAYPA